MTKEPDTSCGHAGTEPCAPWCGRDPEKGRVLGIFFDPPMAIARVGGSKEPMPAYRWKLDENPARGVQTMIEPAPSLIETSVRGNGHHPFTLSVETPDRVQFKDRHGKIKPVAPFFELWARVQDDDGSVVRVPVTQAFLKARGTALRHLRFTVVAANRKAEARTKLASCAAIARKVFSADDYRTHHLDAISPHTEGQVPLVRPDAPLPLGKIRTYVANEGSPDCRTRLDQVRIRFIPGKGDAYGPPEAAKAPASPLPPGAFAPAVTEYGRIHKMTRKENRILSSDTPWLGYNFRTENAPKWPTPMDSYDGARVGSGNGWGLIDDTCDLMLTAELAIDGAAHVAQARAMAGPPDFAPDKRPMYSIRDELEDRELAAAELDIDRTPVEILDLFRRIFETASLVNLDQRRSWALDGNAQLLTEPDETNPDWDAGLSPRLGPKSMREDDAPYASLVPEYTPGQGDTIEPRSGANDRLPYTQVVQQVHARLCDSPILRAFLLRDPDRVRRIVRPPFAHVGELPRLPGVQPDKPVDFGDRTDLSDITYRDPRATRAQTYDMRMPPYMRHSMGVPLSVTRRQYDLLMKYLDKLEGEWKHTVQPVPDAHPTQADT
ncbi:hypothetical protein [Maliponia aquimaris]|uniref:Uncharacterized protein n=1 Tax=Maliponia aquimaris TaxID=1673631 RepID=A0A238L8F8_9RHOB|nr:hypothetical protein [Maliponia aquimaris]SMX50662.1 hypothetical protein MAA8898_04909 [Maliponia aquimaris]